MYAIAFRLAVACVLACLLYLIYLFVSNVVYHGLWPTIYYIFGPEGAGLARATVVVALEDEVAFFGRTPKPTTATTRRR
jgi:hypothetical protein